MVTVEHKEGYSIIDRRGPDPCRVCLCPDDCHSTEYNKPTMDCVRYLRGMIDALKAKCDILAEGAPVDDHIEWLRRERDRLLEQVVLLSRELHEAGDGDTWREACGRCEAEIQRLRLRMQEACGEKDELIISLRQEVRRLESEEE